MSNNSKDLYTCPHCDRNSTYQEIKSAGMVCPYCKHTFNMGWPHIGQLLEED